MSDLCINVVDTFLGTLTRASGVRPNTLCDGQTWFDIEITNYNVWSAEDLQGPDAACQLGHVGANNANATIKIDCGNSDCIALASDHKDVPVLTGKIARVVNRVLRDPIRHPSREAFTYETHNATRGAILRSLRVSGSRA